MSQLPNFGVGWIFQNFTKHHGSPMMGVVYIRKALGKSISKMMIPGVKFKIVKNLISVSTPKFWGWLGFFKNSQNTIGVVYFLKALGKGGVALTRASKILALPGLA